MMTLAFFTAWLVGFFGRRHDDTDFVLPRRGDLVWAKYPKGPPFRVLVVSPPTAGEVECRTDDIRLDCLTLPLTCIKGVCDRRQAA